MNPFSIFQIHVAVKLPNKGKLLIPRSGLRTVEVQKGRWIEVGVSIPHGGLRTNKTVVWAEAYDV